MTPEEILKKAIEMEKEAVMIYSELKKDADSQTTELLDFLISQEREHIRLLNGRLKAIRLLKKD